MRDVEIVEETRPQEVIHRDRVESLRVQQLRVPAEDDHPPLAIERTVRPGGPTGPPVILVHGLAQNRYTWRVSQRSMSGHLAAEGFEVLNLELRGHGNSRAYGAGNARAFTEYVADLARVIDRCEEAPFAMGHSLGGAVVVGAATERELRGIIHLAGVYTFASSNRTLRALARLTLAAQKMLLFPPLRVSTGWAGELLGQLYSVTDIFGYGAPISGWAPGSMERDVLAERLAKGFDWTSVEVWLEMSRWAAHGGPFDYHDRFVGSETPLLVLAGNQDPLARVSDARACFDASGAHDREMVVFDPFEHQVHWGHVDLILGKKAPEVVWPRITDWLRDRG